MSNVIVGWADLFGNLRGVNYEPDHYLETVVSGAQITGTDILGPALPKPETWTLTPDHSSIRRLSNSILILGDLSQNNLPDLRSSRTDPGECLGASIEFHAYKD